ncbi:ribonuclease II [Forsythia ovata]|uniref:Ribonuclease II n=1 Tax=Forsythia ovata TaxID=205694 RepID=A0ABD1WWR5_9LAMI
MDHTMCDIYCELFCRLELKSSEELLENKSGKRMLQKGLLLEFKKDPDRVLLAVAQKHGVKKKWMMIFGSAESLESYCVHLLLSKDNIYFTVLESKCSFSVYGPRLAVQLVFLVNLWAIN